MDLRAAHCYANRLPLWPCTRLTISRLYLSLFTLPISLICAIRFAILSLLRLLMFLFLYFPSVPFSVTRSPNNSTVKKSRFSPAKRKKRKNKDPTWGIFLFVVGIFRFGEIQTFFFPSTLCFLLFRLFLPFTSTEFFSVTRATTASCRQFS